MSIRSERNGAVLTVTIDRPDARNALSLAMSETLIEQWREFRDDNDLRAAILTGAGDKVFCAGADIKEISGFYARMTPLQRRERGEREPGLGGITRNLELGKPVIAAINGHCLAGGLEIAMSCDLRVAVESANFGLPEVTRGIIPGAGGTQRLPRLIPAGMALEMLMTGEPIDAQTALRLGLVNRVVARPALMDSAMELAQRIARNAPLAVQAARHAALKGRHLSLEEGLRLEQFYAEPARQSEDAKEGIQAFVEKRDPVFQGR